MANWPITNPFNPPSEIGTDYGAPLGTPIYAPFPGRVRVQDTGATGWGRSVQLTPGGGDPFKFVGAGHLNDFAVSDGQMVSQGQLLGHTGWSGYVIPAGPQGAHVEIFMQNFVGKWINPTTQPATVDAFFTPATSLNSLGGSLLDIGRLPGAISGVGTSIQSGIGDALQKIAWMALMTIGAGLVVAGLAVLAVSAFRSAPAPVRNIASGVAKRTPQGRVIAVARAKPKAAPASSSTAEPPEYRAGGRVIEMTPAARSRLRERMQAEKAS